MVETLNLYDNIATNLVKNYTFKKHDGKIKDFGVYITCKGYVLGNIKYLISTTIRDGMYYEVTYNNTTDDWYLDAYVKEENICYANEALLNSKNFN